jgi:hypothetical protein
MIDRIDEPFSVRFDGDEAHGICDHVSRCFRIEKRDASRVARLEGKFPQQVPLIA